MNKETKKIIQSYNEIKKEHFKKRTLSYKESTENKIEAIKFFLKEYGFYLKSMSKEEFYKHLLIEECYGNMIIYFKWFDHKEELFKIDKKYGYKKTLSKLSQLKTISSENLSIEKKISKIISYSGDRLEIFKKMVIKRIRKKKMKVQDS